MADRMICHKGIFRDTGCVNAQNRKSGICLTEQEKCGFARDHGDEMAPEKK
ncbi:MAG: hypothetical protein SO016_10400 [Lachnospiraceae bacterium]|nr:hypothetical protein [Robinsoniella sp.]MDY3767076.1 hypothetical protein [Lachnospiraceae bacterium]